MPAFKALEISSHVDIGAFSRLLWAHRIPHRIVDDAGRQLLIVGDEAHIALVRQAFQRFERGELDDTAAGFPEAPRPAAVSTWAQQLFLAYPITLIAIVLSIAGAAVVAIDGKCVLLHWLSFADFHLVGAKLVFDPVAPTYARGQYWRLVTPIFLHFGALHLVFNMLWLWELGRRIEKDAGSHAMFALVLLTGAGGNIAQYMADGAVMFGGMSGVIYGTLGYTWMWNWLSRGPRILLPPGVLGFMLIWLLVCMIGFVQALGFGAVANAAHAGGLVLGMVVGVGAAMLQRVGPVN